MSTEILTLFVSANSNNLVASSEVRENHATLKALCCGMSAFFTQQRKNAPIFSETRTGKFLDLWYFMVVWMTPRLIRER
jgi:hypothetical protein